VAPPVERWTCDQQVVDSNPTRGESCVTTLQCFLLKHKTCFMILFHLFFTIIQPLVKGLCQKATSPSRHPSRRQIDSSDLNLHLIHGSLGPCESVPQTASRSVQPFLHGSRTCPSDTHTHTHTHIQTDHATPSVGIACVLVNACDVA